MKRAGVNKELVSTSAVNMKLLKMDCHPLIVQKKGGNPIIEPINGWIKEEMRLDFNHQKQESLPAFLDSFVHYFNHERPAYALNYKTLVQFKTEQGF